MAASNIFTNPMLLPGRESIFTLPRDEEGVREALRAPRAIFSEEFIGHSYESPPETVRLCRLDC